MPEKSQIVAIVLAAGSSRRFGSNKLRHPLTLGGVTKPLIEHSLQPWLEVFEQITVIISKDSDRFYNAIDSTPGKLNSDYLLEPSFPRRRESSKKNKPRSGQNMYVDLLCRCFCELGKKPPIPANPDSIDWIPACAGMTDFRSNGKSRINWIVCENSADGISASLACGVRANINASGWVIGLADMPKVPSTAIAGVRDALLQGANLAAPFCNGKRGHPVGFASPYKEDLLLLSGDTGARHLLERDKANLARIKTNDHGIFLDVDTQIDLKNISL